jgi:hypothetical protein
MAISLIVGNCESSASRKASLLLMTIDAPAAFQPFAAVESRHTQPTHEQS